MPRPTFAIPHTPNGTEEEQVVEGMLGGKRSGEIVGIHWALMGHKNNDSSSIYVHPPTPDKMMSPSSDSSPQETITTPLVTGILSSPRTSPDGSPSSSNRNLTSVPIPGSKALLPMQVLPEVRSPPRRTIAMAADSLQITQRRGRRPRLFGFTELPDSSDSSVAPSPAGSRHTSPERTPTSDVSTPAPSLHTASSSSSSTTTVIGPATSAPSNFIPRRQPIRAKSEQTLPTMPTTSTSAPAQPHIPPRKRENGLKLDFTGIIPLEGPRTTSVIVPSPFSAKLIRKKSGEILKPALKYGGPLAPNGTPLQTPIALPAERSASPEGRGRFESKSCPSTPSCPKYVHFDSQLERVKLFLQDQKPQVVSRAGSPEGHYTTSEGEEYPFPPTDDERDEAKVLQIRLPNFPTSHPPDSDLYLESLFLDDDRKSLRGIIACKNLSFQKWVAVRFTLDWWQTTSEVTASHKDSVKGGLYDRFTFIIKLSDILAKIEEKTLFLAIRYSTDGREIWDSNGGANYQVNFEKVAPVPKATAGVRTRVGIEPGMGKAVGGRTSQWSVAGGNTDDRLADLRAKLSRLTGEDSDSPALAPITRDRGNSFAYVPKKFPNGFGSPSGSPQRSFTTMEASGMGDLPSAGPALAARYDLGSALKSSSTGGRRNSNSPSGIGKADLPDVRTGLLQFNAGAGARTNYGHAATDFYSPRFSPNTQSDMPLPIPSSDYFFSPPAASPASLDTSNIASPMLVPDLHVQGPSPEPAETSPTIKKSSVRPALPRSKTSPAGSVSTSATSSPPQLDASGGAGSVSDTPSESPKSPLGDGFGWDDLQTNSRDDVSLASYSSFIEQFCWGGAAPPPPPMDGRRSHSSSSLDGYKSHAENEGNVTPRPLSKGNNGVTTPSSTGSYYTSYTSTPNTARDVEEVEEGLRSMGSSPGGIEGLRIGMGRNSPRPSLAF